MRRILFAGGGTLGPVTPLLTVARRLRQTEKDVEFAWAGTDSGPERELIEAEGIPFVTIPIAKLPRFLSPKLLTLPIDYVRALRASKRLLQEIHPKLVLAAGGFTAVPVVREAVARNIPCITHQLDQKPLLSNRLIAKHCRYVTTSYAYSRAPFGTHVVTYQIPTPVRFRLEDMPTREAACRYFGFDPGKPVLLVVGGGTGSLQLNDAVARIDSRIPGDIQIIHVMGRGKEREMMTNRAGYIAYDFLTDDMLTALTAADLIVSRAGFGAISEFAALKKAVILVPLPDSPQEANVSSLGDTVVSINSHLEEWEDGLLDAIGWLSGDAAARSELGERLHERIPTDGGEALARLAMSVIL